MGKLNPDFSNLGKNPVRKLRESKKLSVAKLSVDTGVSAQVIRDIEAGQPQNIPFGLQKFFDVEFPDSKIDEQYQNWRTNKRNCVYLPPVENLKMSESEHPFAQYRSKLGLSAATICEYLCVPRFVVRHYELNQRRMPRLLKTALREAHLSDFDIRKLANYGEIFFTNKEVARINAQAHSS